jgi:hypothetical protein
LGETDRGKTESNAEEKRKSNSATHKKSLVSEAAQPRRYRPVLKTRPRAGMSELILSLMLQFGRAELGYGSRVLVGVWTLRFPAMIPTAAAVLCGLLFASAPVLAALDRVPVLDVKKSCRAAESYGLTDSKATFHNCMLDEQEARAQLGQKWSKFKLSSRRACLPSHPIPSYVEMLTCLEMYQDALLPDQGEGAAPAGGTPSGYVHDSPSPRPAMSPGPRPAGSF